MALTTGTRIKPPKVFRIPQSSAANPSTHTKANKQTNKQTDKTHTHIHFETGKRDKDESG